MSFTLDPWVISLDPVCSFRSRKAIWPGSGKWFHSSPNLHSVPINQAPDVLLGRGRESSSSPLYSCGLEQTAQSLGLWIDCYHLLITFYKPIFPSLYSESKQKFASVAFTLKEMGRNEKYKCEEHFIQSLRHQGYSCLPSTCFLSWGQSSLPLGELLLPPPYTDQSTLGHASGAPGVDMRIPSLTINSLLIQPQQLVWGFI